MTLKDSDLIRRGDALKEIDKTRALMPIAKLAEQNAILRVPTVEEMEVVRCRECRHSESWYADKSRCFLWNEDGIDVFNDGFCSYGKRRESGGQCD